MFKLIGITVMKETTANSKVEKGDICSVAVTYKDFNSTNDILCKQRKL